MGTAKADPLAFAFPRGYTGRFLPDAEGRIRGQQGLFGQSPADKQILCISDLASLVFGQIRPGYENAGTDFHACPAIKPKALYIRPTVRTRIKNVNPP